MKKLGVLLVFIPFLFLTGCAEKKAGEMDDALYSLESDFKVNYQKWVDIKADGSVQYAEYALDIKAIGHQFEALGNRAASAAMQKKLSAEDKEIYATYKVLGKQIYQVGHDLYYNKREEAKTTYQAVLDKEEELKR